MRRAEEFENRAEGLNAKALESWRESYEAMQGDRRKDKKSTTHLEEESRREDRHPHSRK